jgi:uncharacterized membrane protein
VLPSLALVFNAFVWGVSWFPFRQIEAHGLHPVWATALIYALIFVAMGWLRRHAWQAFSAHPALVLLGLAAGLTNLCFNWAVTAGDVVRVVLLFYLMPAVVVCCWAGSGAGRKARRRRGARARGAGAGGRGQWCSRRPQARDWPVPASLADCARRWPAGFCFAVTNVSCCCRLRAAAGRIARMLAVFGGCALVLAGGVAALGLLHRARRHRGAAAARSRARLAGLGRLAADAGLRGRQPLPAVRRRAAHGPAPPRS